MTRLEPEAGSRYFAFDFAISFAGPERAIAEQLAQGLTNRGAVTFYDASYRARLVGKRLDREFSWIFGEATRYFVPLVSQSYVERSWPQLEWEIARREGQSREEEFVLPVRCDDSLLFGLPRPVGYLDLRELSVEEVADVLMEKLSGVLTTRDLPVQDWVAAFGVSVAELLDGELPEDAPRDHPHLCDWLTRELLVSLRRAPVAQPRVVEDAPNGETLTVRAAFTWTQEMGPVKFGPLGWWEVLEVLPFHVAYP